MMSWGGNPNILILVKHAMNDVQARVIQAVELIPGNVFLDSNVTNGTRGTGL